MQSLDIAVESKPAIQVIASLQSTHMYSSRVLLKEIRDIKAMLEEEKKKNRNSTRKNQNRTGTQEMGT